MSIHAHPALPEFEYLRPATLAEASEFLAGHPEEARPFLGGTDVFVRMRDGFSNPRYLVDVKCLSGMDTFRFDPHEGLTLGAAVSMNRTAASPEVMAHYPLLAEACRSVASYQLRTRATVAGNICNASPAGDTIGACLAYDGVLQIHGVDGFCQQSLAGFFLGPGKTKLRPGDVVTGVRLPPPPKDAAGVYLKLGRNRQGDLSIVGVSVLGYTDPAAPSGYRFRITLASVAPVPLVAGEAEAYLSANQVTAEAICKAADLAAAACSPIDDVRGSALYRREMARNLTRKGLEQVWHSLNGA